MNQRLIVRFLYTTIPKLLRDTESQVQSNFELNGVYHTVIVLREQHFGFVRFFYYAGDLSLFPETGKGLTCAVFTESVDLRPDWWIWHYILESSTELLPGAKRMVFACPWARAYGVRSEVEMYSLLQRGVSEVVQPCFRFIKPCFCFRVESSVLAGRPHFQTEDGLKSVSYPAPQPIYVLWKTNRKIYRIKNVAFSRRSESAAIYCFYPFLFVISAEFIILFFGLEIAVEKWYQMCLINFKSSLIAKELELILCSFLSSDVRKLACGKKKIINFWTKTDRIFFRRENHSSWSADQCIWHPFFDTKFFSWGTPVWKF